MGRRRPHMTRTNIEIDDTCVAVIMERYGVTTKTDAVDLALRHLAGQPMTRAEAVAMHGADAIGDLPRDHDARHDRACGDESAGKQ